MVAERVAYLRAQRAGRVQVSSDRIVQEIERVALFDLRGAVRWGGDQPLEYRASEDLDDDTAAAIAEVSEEVRELVQEDGSVVLHRRRRIRQAPKIAALKLLAEIKGLVGRREGPEAAGPGKVHRIRLGETWIEFS